MPGTPVTLQTLLWPEPDLCTERDLYMRLSGPCALSLPERALQFRPGGKASFGGYANLFNSGKWASHCDLDRLWLRLEGAGQFELVVYYALPDHARRRQVNQVITLEAGQPLSVDLRPKDGFAAQSALFFELLALSDGALLRADWQTDQQPLRQPQLMLSVTTFRREEAVTRTVRRFVDYMDTSPIRDHLHLSVVDNGQSAVLPTSPHVTLIENENLGGSGGFARGLLEAQRRGASHCLFMDDDASVHMEAFERTWVFLAYATDPATAVAGAVADAKLPWMLWENGALFHQSCRPQHMGTDLRDVDQVLEVEFASSAPAPRNFYGGWWYFAFPVDHVRHMPFPFFVRGDDVSFGLVHDFNTVTLPGVMSFPDENFANKESLQTLYLDLRSHLAHHMAIPHMDIGRRATLRIALWFFARSLFQCHYETLAALNLSFADFMAGPEFFAANADMAERRATIGALRQDEAWKEGHDAPAPARRRINPDYFLVRALMILSLNGHLLPFFKRFGDRVELDAGQRGALHQVWGAAQVTYRDASTGKGFTVTHSKRRALRELARFARLAWRFWRDYDSLKTTWQSAYPELANAAWWRQRMGLSGPEDTGTDKA